MTFIFNKSYTNILSFSKNLLFEFNLNKLKICTFVKNVCHGEQRNQRIG